MKKTGMGNDQISVHAKIVAYTAFLVTLLFWSQGTDPFNLPKLGILTMGAFALLGSKLNVFSKIHFQPDKIFEIVLSALIILGLATSFLLSGAPKWQMLYGVYARNTGLICYLSLLIIFLFAANLKNFSELSLVVKWFVVASFAVIAVSLIELTGLNIQGVNSNIKMSLISTFGNSNFVSAFLGMSGVVYFNYLIGWKTGLWKKFVIFSLLILSSWLILKSQSKQGLIVLFTGCSLILGFYLLSKTKKTSFKIAYFFLVFVLGTFSLAGFMNSGPLADLIYKSSVGYRFEYWKAGLVMFREHLFTGVGLNSYGDWYRASRPESALKSPGPDVITNTAHNVYIDLAATGGVFLLLGFLFLIVITFIASLKVILRSRNFDPAFYSIFGAWIVYLLQATISIDQIGLAIWGWVLSGLIISYEKVTRSNQKSEEMEKNSRVKVASKVELTSASTVLGIVIGIAVAIAVITPPLRNDFNLRKAYDSTSAELLIKSTNDWPTDTFRSANIAAILLNNRLAPEALVITKKGLLTNPRSFDLWNLTYANPVATYEERKVALEKMKELDPLNKNVLSKVLSR